MLEAEESEPSEHREMALHHLYRALWRHTDPAHHHHNVLVSSSWPGTGPFSLTRLLTHSCQLYHAQGAGKPLLDAIEAQMERLGERLVTLITRYATSLYVFAAALVSLRGLLP
jgi:hypothetical protein